MVYAKARYLSEIDFSLPIISSDFQRTAFPYYLLAKLIIPVVTSSSFRSYILVYIIRLSIMIHDRLLPIVLMGFWFIETAYSVRS